MTVDTHIGLKPKYTLEACAPIKVPPLPAVVAFHRALLLLPEVPGRSGKRPDLAPDAFAHYRFLFPGPSGRLSLTENVRALCRSASFRSTGRPCFLSRSANASSANS